MNKVVIFSGVGLAFPFDFLSSILTYYILKRQKKGYFETRSRGLSNV